MSLRAIIVVGLLTGDAVALMACGSSAAPAGGPARTSNGSQGSSGGGSSDAASGSSSGNAPEGSSGTPSQSPGAGDSAAGSVPHSGDDGASTTDSGPSSEAGDSGGEEGGACVKGQVQPSEVVMLGDSYMDLGHVGPTIEMVAGATYRTYYLLGAALNYGSGQFNIPYQFDSMAVAANPDIKVVITDGGGNDLLIDNRQCLTTPVQGDTQCHMVIDGSLMKAQQLLQDMASKGVKDVVYFFYPHVDPTALFTGPNSNDWLDYAYPLAAQMCCGTSTPAPGSPDLTCRGSGAGVDCVFVDTRPEFVGHNDPTNQSAYWFQDGIHPTQPGADAIANKVWAQMQKYCIAQ